MDLNFVIILTIFLKLNTLKICCGSMQHELRLFFGHVVYNILVAGMATM